MPTGSGAAPGSASAERRPSIRRLHERQNGSYHTIEGHRGHDLVRRASIQDDFGRADRPPLQSSGRPHKRQSARRRVAHPLQRLLRARISTMDEDHYKLSEQWER
jgi:hypothetical protein